MSSPKRAIGRMARAEDRPTVLHVMGCTSVQYGSFEDHLVCLAEACSERGLAAAFAYPVAPASGRFVNHVRAAGGRVLVAPGTAETSSRGAAAVWRLVRETKPVITHGHFGRPAYAAVAAARALGVPQAFLTKHHTSGPEAGLSHRTALRTVATMADALICVSDACRDDARHLGVPNEKLVVMPIGVDAHRFHPARRGECARMRAELEVADADHVVLCVSHLRQGKGIEHLIAAMPTVVRTRPGTILLIAGDGPEREMLHEAAQHANIEEHVRFLGMRDDVDHLLAAADVFVSPSLSEGGGLTAVEAMASGIAVVSTTVGLADRLASEGAVLGVQPRNVPELAGALMRLLGDDKERAALAAAGRRAVERDLDAPVLAERLAELYQGVPASALEVPA